MSPERTATVTRAPTPPRPSGTSTRQVAAAARGEFDAHRARRFVPVDHHALEDVLDAGEARDAGLDGRAEDSRRFARGHDAPALVDVGALAERQRLVAAVRHVDDGQPQLAVRPPEVGDDVELHRFVERGERLVEQQEARAGGQRAREGDALRLAAGDVPRQTTRGVPDVEFVEQFERPRSAFGARQVREGEGDVRERVEMREEREVLEDVARAARADGKVDALVGVEEGVVADPDRARVGADETGERLERQGLPRPRSAEEHGHAGREGEVNVEREPVRFITTGELLSDPRGEHHLLWPVAVSRLVV